MMHSAAGAVLWAVTVIALWGGAAWAAVHLLRRPHRRPRPTLPSPLDILERRYAAGDMTREDFDEARARLREHELDI